MKSAPGASLGEASDMSGADNDQAQDHLNTLVKAHGILSNPDHMSRVHALVGRHVGAVKGIKSVDDLKSLWNEKYGAGSGFEKSSGKQENDLNSDHATMQKGDGSDGNVGAAPYGSMGHSQSSPGQQNPLKFAKVGKSGSGSDGN